MADQDIPEGRRFSQVYLNLEGQLEDSPRARRRVGSTLFQLLFRVNAHLPYSFYADFVAETGLPQEVFTGTQAAFSKIFSDIPLRDFLDAPTVAFAFATKSKLIQNHRSKEIAQSILPEIRRIFSEERLRYFIDQRGGVHLNVDAQFEVNRASAVQHMGVARYAATRESLERGYQALDATPPDGTHAIRGVFEAAENVFKTMFSVPRLAVDQTKQLKAEIDRLNAGDAAALRAAQRMRASFEQWVEAAHHYRHAAGEPELPHQPPLDLAILAVSQGTSFVRWLVSIDRQMNPPASGP